MEYFALFKSSIDKKAVDFQHLDLCQLTRAHSKKQWSLFSCCIILRWNDCPCGLQLLCMMAWMNCYCSLRKTCVIELDNNIFGGRTTFPVPSIAIVFLFYFVNAREPAHTYENTRIHRLRGKLSFPFDTTYYFYRLAVNTTIEHSYVQRKRSNRKWKLHGFTLVQAPYRHYKSFRICWRASGFQWKFNKILLVLNVELLSFYRFVQPEDSVDSEQTKVSTRKNGCIEYLRLHKIFYKHLGNKSS